MALETNKTVNTKNNPKASQKLTESKNAEIVAIKPKTTIVQIILIVSLLLSV
jgi:hypothetical protein